MDGSNKDVGLDNFNAGDGESKVGFSNMYSGDVIVMLVELMIVGGIDTNGGDDANCGDGDSKVDWGDNLDGGDSDKKR